MPGSYVHCAAMEGNCGYSEEKTPAVMRLRPLNRSEPLLPTPRAANSRRHTDLFRGSPPMPSSIPVNGEPTRNEDDTRAQPATRASHWLSVVSHLDPKYGGVSAVVPQLASVLSSAERFQVAIGSFCLPEEQYYPPAYPELALQYWPSLRRSWLLHRSHAQSFRHIVEASDGVHIHGIWQHSTLVAARTARGAGKPYIVSAHGMLAPRALARRRTRKHVYTAVFGRRTLPDAACLHALTQAEANDYRAFGCRQPIAIIPNAVAGARYLVARSLSRAVSSAAGGRHARAWQVAGRGRRRKKRGWSPSPFPQICVVTPRL